MSTGTTNICFCILKKNYSPFYWTYKPSHLEQICLKLNRYSWGKYLIHGPKHRNDNQSQSIKRPCYDDVTMSLMASQITSLTIVYSTVYSGADQRKLQSSASLAFVWGIHRGPVNSLHKRPVTRKMFPFDDVIMPAEHPSWDVNTIQGKWFPQQRIHSGVLKVRGHKHLWKVCYCRHVGTYIFTLC